VHGWPVTGLYYDVSLFQVDTQNLIESQTSGPGQTVDVNSGNAHSRGAELEGDYDVLRLFRGVPASQHLAAFLNASLLDAKIVHSITPETSAANSPTETGNTPAYAPHYVVKAGLTWREDGRFKLSLVEQTVGSEYWKNSNQPKIAGGLVTSPARIPQYTVLDLSGDYTVYRHLRLLGGISNLGDRTYYSRVFFANAGIEPANGRTFYAGAAVDF
jgi:Fe(3+) dicitrate transport protein